VVGGAVVDLVVDGAREKEIVVVWEMHRVKYPIQECANEGDHV
jgi:hypothetical protein